MTQNYYVLGAYWEGDGESYDMTPTFVSENRWENGYKNGSYSNIINIIEVGAKVAIKALVFGGENHKIAYMRIKAVGTVTKNLQDGVNLEVDWNKDFEEFDFKGGGYGSTASRVLNKWYIKKIFFNGRDYKEEKIVRLCWNTEGWTKPSGRKGKSKNQKTHEGKFGFGNEEWLLEYDKLIDGYQYGFLQPIQRSSKQDLDVKYDVQLYTIDGESKKRYFIGDIKNLEALSEEEATNIYQVFKNEGLLDEMEQQIITGEDAKKEFVNWKGIDVINVKFRPRDAYIPGELEELPPEHYVYSLDRYSFNDYKEAVTPQTRSRLFDSDTSGDNNIDSEKGPRPKSKRTQKAQTTTINNLHKKISKELTLYLESEFGKEKVKREKNTGYGTLIDILVNNDNYHTFFEIKVNSSALAAVREALGQLMEYSLFPDQKNAHEMIITTIPLGGTPEAGMYVKHIRETYGIPIYYWPFDLETKKLLEKY